jgi:fibronectin type 3 domain-containing protein
MRRLNLLVAVCVGLSVAGCDSDSPVEPQSPALTAFSRDVGSGLSATAISPSEIDLAWPRSSGPVNGYEVFRSTTGATGPYSIVATAAATATGYADLGLTGSTTYCYEVRSFKIAGKNTMYSAFSAAACATTLAPPISAPSSVDVVPIPNDYYVDAYNSAVRVSWKDNSANEDGFYLERASAATGPWTRTVTTSANVTLQWDYGARERQICFRVIAFSAAGVSTPSSPDCTAPPANPTNLAAKADGQSINLTWTDNSAVEDGYKVSRLDAAGTWVDIAALPPNAVSYRDIGVTVDMTYTYRVQAQKDGGFSNYTNESAAVIPTAPPAPPSGASAGYWTANEYGWLYLDVAWIDASNNEEGFRIEVSYDGVSGWQPYATVAANMTSFEDKLSLWDNLGGRAECYRVIAFNGTGVSTPSNVTCAEWAHRPTNLTATAVDQHSIDLSWTDNGAFEYGYVVFRSTDINGPYDIVTETSANATSYRDTGLASGQEYWYSVAADFGAGYDTFNYSDYASATTLSATTSAALSVQSSRTVINNHMGPMRIRGRMTLQDVRARYRASTSRSVSPSSHRR